MSVASGTVRTSPPSRSPAIINVTSPVTANTEFTQTINATVKQFIIRARGSSTLKLAFNTGETTTNFITISKHASLSQENLDTTNLTLYLNTDQGSETIEIFYWS